MTTDVQAESKVLHIIGRNFDFDPSVDQMADRLTNLSGLITCAVYVEKVNDYRAHGVSIQGRTKFSSQESLLSKAKAETATLRVGRLRYNSPLDVLLYTAGGGGTTGAMWSVLRLYSYALDIAKKHSDTRLHMEKNEVIREHLARAAELDKGPSRSFLKKLLKAKGANQELAIIIDQASKAIAEIEVIRAEPA